jgi:hypothetical protein
MEDVEILLFDWAKFHAFPWNVNGLEVKKNVIIGFSSTFVILFYLFL